MKRNTVYEIILAVSALAYAVTRLYWNIYIKNVKALDLIIVFALIFSLYLVRILHPQSKYKNNKSAVLKAVINALMVTVAIMLPNLFLFNTNQKTSGSIDYASQHNFGRATPYLYHVDNATFNELYQKLIDNDWKKFYLPATKIPGDNVISATTAEDEIIVEYGDKSNVTTRFIQRRNGTKTDNNQFSQLNSDEYIADSLSYETTINRYTVTCDVTTINSNTNSTVKIVYSFWWEYDGYTFYIESIHDFSEDTSKIERMIASVNSLEIITTALWS